MTNQTPPRTIPNSDILAASDLITSADHFAGLIRAAAGREDQAISSAALHISELLERALAKISFFPKPQTEDAA